MLAPALSAMKLFQRLFNFLPGEIQQAERRLQSRYAIGPDFPLTVGLAFGDWSGAGKVRDLAVGGVGVFFAKKPGFEAGVTVRIALGLEKHEILAEGLVRHVRPEKGGLLCGLSLDHEARGTRQAFLQLLIPVATGVSLQPLKPELIKQNEPGLRKIVYADDSTRLTVWERESGSGPFSFEFSMGDHLVRGQAGGSALQTFSRVHEVRPHRVAEFAPNTAGSELEADVRRLFRWSALNIQGNLPAAHREMLVAVAR